MTYLLSLLPFVLVFIASLFRAYDSDLGWHLKYGEYFFQNNYILRENIFSTSMPHYNWINHSWGTDVILYTIYNNFGFLGLTIIGALVVTLTFYFFSKAAHLSVWDKTLLFPLTLYFVLPVIQVSLRSQIISLLFLGMLFYLLSRYAYNNRSKLFLLFPLFLVWVNIHGQFILGVIVFILWAVLELGKKLIFKEEFTKAPIKKEIIFFIGMLSSIILITFINPFGLGVYHEAFNHFGNPSQKYILEWVPFEQLSELWWKHIVLGILILFSIFFMFFSEEYKKKFPFIILIVFFLVLSFWMKRYAWPTYLISMLCLSPIANFFKPNSSSVTQKSAIIILVFFILGTAFTKWPFTQFTAMSWDVYCQEFNKCSPDAAEYIVEHKLTSNLLTFYNWGGWLIWKYPRIKPSIDGRMPFWKDEKGYSAFAEYYPYEQNQKDIDTWKYNVVLMSPDKPMYDRLIELTEKKKWKLVYSDDVSGIFVRNKKTQ